MPCRWKEIDRGEDGNSMTGSKISQVEQSVLTAGSTISDHNQASQYIVQSGANFEPIQKYCFTPSCEHRGIHWIGVIGRLMNFNGQVVPYYVCEECHLLFKNDPSTLFGQPIDKQNSVQKKCYNRYCDNNGVHWIKIVSASIAQAGYELFYCICNECYAIIEETGEVRPKKSHIRKYEDKRPITGKKVISNEDLCHLLESSKSCIDGRIRE
jgi:hypothetical protein